MNPFDYLNAINYTKNDVISTSENPEKAEKMYQPYLVNRGLSYFADTVLYCNEMNRFPNLDKKLQFDFLLNSIRKNKRFSKWHKAEVDEETQLVCDYYKCSIRKAKEIVTLLSTDQLRQLKEKMQIGGARR
ncbi:DNA polymerase clamp loader subunit A [bacterium]|nr:DNA polymerase clamp loader subunit A [bacterium]